jgi:hypothetical protein
MTECLEKGCRNLQTTCVTCGRVVCTATFPKDEWIKCSERLPEPSDGHFCSEDVLIASPLWVMVGYLDGYKKWKAYDLSNEDTQKVSPSHWMKFPSPPKEE